MAPRVLKGAKDISASDQFHRQLVEIDKKLHRFDPQGEKQEGSLVDQGEKLLNQATGLKGVFLDITNVGKLENPYSPQKIAKFKRLTRQNICSSPSTTEKAGLKRSFTLTKNLPELPSRKFLVSKDYENSTLVLAEVVSQPC